jgi:hypothetical protein
VEREQFHTLLINYAALTEGEAAELTQLSRKFPYSQVIHNLSARAAQDNSLPSREKLLHLSAIYCTDRTALKSVMVAPRKKRLEQIAPEEIPSPPTEEAGNDFHEQVIKNIASLQESKRLYEMTIERMEQEKSFPLVAKKEAPPDLKPKAHDSLIEEIRSTKKKIRPEGPKQKEQIEIIDQFIKTQPSMPRPKGVPQVIQDHDLSEPSEQFGENIVSETLVEILLKQGKKEKAIEALKKLIWKFPQKKAYFAAQIDDLRK